eukprot:TRINITY_DN21637_c0_g1_i1.p1 TRINITY_DN21637_c0_g1~~TRINITY_DN21637_c0_g1_i1.p1  ORF type:complete len:385 (+),score=59.00 TRINITY_DN21637_c0_g1_i1:67-1155(+)
MRSSHAGDLEDARQLTRGEVFQAALENTVNGVEKMVSMLEDSSVEDPVVSEEEAGGVVALLVYCADNLTKLEETVEGEHKRGFLPKNPGSVGGSGRESLGESTGLLANLKHLKLSPNANNRQSLMSTYSMYTEGGGKIDIPKKPRFTRKMIRYLALAGIMWQVLSVCLLMILSKVMKKGSDDESGELWVKFVLTILCVFQVIHVLTTISFMYKIGMQIAHHTISIETLVQSYGSTIMAMAGIYYLFMAMNHTSFDGFKGKRLGQKWSADHDVITGTPEDQWLLFIHLVYLSCTTMTGCGYGDLTPVSWYAVLAIMLEQLLSVFFATVIFGLGLQHFTTRLHTRKKALELRKQIQENEWEAAA